ncbi:MAG: Rrf2 family transcriptional regulator [Nitrospirae bacterium]|nr:Rrf2 family transcriptional regulator [Nitrospirota bacterium]
MLKLSKKTDYALMAIQYMAYKGTDRVVNTKEIAEEYKIPVELLAKVLQKLGKKGLIASQNGPKGGYVLAKSPDTISVLSIIQAIEGHVGITECYHNEDSQCVQMAHCNIRNPIRNIQNSIYGLLDSMSIEDMSSFNTSPITPSARLYSHRT